MTLKSLTIVALIASGFGSVGTDALAQSRIQEIPANFPPASFSGTQFVDNRGCVYIRAGFDGAVTWVPRVSRARQQICGQKPTFGTVSAQVAPAPRAAEQPVQITAPAPAPKVAAAPAPKPAQVVRKTTTTVRTPAKPAQIARTAPTPQPTIRRVPAPAYNAQPPRVVRRVPAPAPQQVAPDARTVRAPAYTGGPCANGKTTRTAYGQTVTVRCGPQTTPHVTVIRRGEAPGPGKNVYYNKGWEGSSLNLPGNTRIVPRHVYEKRDTQIAVVPSGYRPAWEDDRLNPERAYQTVDGYMATQQVWTNTVPRRLVTQVRRHKVKEPVIAYRATGERSGYVSTQGTQRDPVIATRSAPKNPASGARYVEIGLFTTEAKANAAASRLSAAGLPVRMSTITRSGTTMKRLVVGPYGSSATVNAALAAVRSVGYTQASLR